MSVSNEKDWFTFRIIYFKPSGKYYTETNISWEIRCTGGNVDKPNSGPNMYDVIAKIRGLNQPGSALPGLTGDWNGPIFIDCEEGFPCLILPYDEVINVKVIG